MKVKNVSPLGDVNVPALLGKTLVKAGEVIDVPDEFGKTLLAQPANWVEEKGSAK